MQKTKELIKQRNKKNKGITLIALVITIIVLIILAGISINLVLGENGLFTKAQKAAKDMDIASLKEQIGTELLSMQIENEENNFAVDESDVEKVLSKYGKIIRSEEGNIIGLKPTGKDYEIPFSEIWQGETTNSYNEIKKVNTPKLAEGMIPIKYNDNEGKWEICSEEDSNWYNYDESHKEWANVMLSDGKYKGETAKIGQKIEDTELGSMFVWIPRYAYSINEYGVKKDGEGETQNITDVTFLVGTTNKDEQGTKYALDYDTGEVEKAKAEGQKVSTPKIVHPAFNFGGKNLSGIWVAKFEASMEGQGNTNTTTGDDITTKNIKVLPNVQSWRCIRVGNAFTNCLEMNDSSNIYGITSAVDSHLMKNSEWGAVAYLSASQYGITPTINNLYKIDSGKYKAYTGGENYSTNLKQSTTGNITGVYDMCGGAYEFVAAYYDNKNDNIGTNGTTTYFEENELKAEYEKYWDKYEVDEEEKTATSWENNNQKIKELAEERLKLMKDIKGVGMYDVKNTFSFYGKIEGSWAWMTDVTTKGNGVGIYNNDITLVGNISRPFLLRGGCWGDGPDAGIFTSVGDWGSLLNSRRLPSSANYALIASYALSCTLIAS